MHRRVFLRTTIAAAAGTLSLQAFPHHAFAAHQPKEASDIVTLGPMGVRASRMALGTGTNGINHQSEQTRSLGAGGVAALFKLAYDHGVTFWDSADQYGSHPCLREALQTVPRDKVTILTKTEARTEREMRADLDRFRREIGSD